ncbi:hypothetical protein BT63DRAFT_411578 [Microthyrium microscopicum]|uniref:Thioredoxin domain-containing protein n=1 Tax=Microthyrium microscopicum TaxID=703497 RepID=A0A6A6UMJ1_9PEZI|nr:hypothetical protein BT63DRAFT_411578 [Microthyrium microscopicum]
MRSRIIQSPLLHSLLKPLPTTPSIHLRAFATTKPRPAKNRVFDPVRSPAEFQTLLLLHTTRSAPLLTLWTASWCRTCAEIEPLIRSLIELEHYGLEQGGVGYVPIELDSPTIGDVGTTYSIKSMPTLLAFSRGEPQWDTRVTDPKMLEDRDFLIKWIEEEARRGGKGGAGGGLFGGLFGR